MKSEGANRRNLLNQVTKESIIAEGDIHIPSVLTKPILTKREIEEALKVREKDN